VVKGVYEEVFAISYIENSREMGYRMIWRTA